jgi:hypothetical protein
MAKRSDFALPTPSVDRGDSAATHAAYLQGAGIRWRMSFQC